MSKKVWLFAVALVLLTPVLAQDVAEAELRSVQDRAIEFINYVGPYTRVDSVAEIRGIGTALGQAIAAGARQAGDRSRFFVIHAVDPSQTGGFDADILFLGPGTNVDHVRNLRRIIGAYLEAAYGYSQRDAETLAVFITIYNAVYRQQLDYFRPRYKQVVLNELTAENAGLALRWDEWPGRSRIVVPLTTRPGSTEIGAVATSPISDPATVESLRQESDDAGVAVRQDLVDIKERELETETAAVEAERQRIEAAEEQLQADIAARDAEAHERPTDPLRPAESPADATPPGPGQEAGIVETEAARQEDRELAERAAAIEADRVALAEREAAVEERRQEISADRESIAADQKEAIAQEVAAASEDERSAVLLFELQDPLKPLSRLVLVNLDSGRRIRRSELNTIWASTAVDIGDAIIAVAGMATASGGTIRLVRVDKADFSKVVQSSQEIFADTTIWYHNNAIYAVTRQRGSWVIGRYDTARLQLQASSAAVSQWTSLSSNDSRLVAQSPGGAFLILDAASLQTIAELSP